ncbi:DIS3 mitotic control [Phytophthora boehmeriae]|uniref:DIS3 mitotic control n=1 Tax=Phytophthora boehmeriae TaxID=109152 RepID=A0A8T1X6Q8_9STRA|nr:DIS3 mitotic control [Phytophthora boehmeriae]
MEEKLRRWKQQKQESTRGKKDTRPGSGATAAPSGVKRKLAAGPTRASESKSVELKSKIPPAQKHPRVSGRPLTTKAAAIMKPRLAAEDSCNKPPTSAPVVQREIRGCSSMDKENRAVNPPNQQVQEPFTIVEKVLGKELELHKLEVAEKILQVSKELETPQNDHLQEREPLGVVEKISTDKKKEFQLVGEEKLVDKEPKILNNLIRGGPSPTVELRPELLAKDLVGVAIGFEKKRRLSTAFSIFKRAYHLLPNASVKLAERLARLQREYPAVVDHVPSQKFVTAIYMQKVLERDLMSVLNDGSKNDLMNVHSIGDKRAELVLGKRPFHQLEDLQQVPGITVNVLAKLYEHHTNWENHR